MKNRYNVYNSLERAFLSVQNTIRKLKQGSVIRSLFYSISTEMANVYSEIDKWKNNIYFDTASGEYLDALIEGFVRLPRRQATYSFGYVVIELGEALTTSNIANFSMAFVQYDRENNAVKTNYSGISTFIVTKDNVEYRYHICQPQFYDLTDDVFERDPVTREQRLFTIYKNYLSDLITANNNKPIKKLILPVVSETAGSAANLESESLDTIDNFGFPATVKNLFYVETYAPSPQITEWQIADIDGVLSLPQTNDIQLTSLNFNYRVLGDYSYITGGANEESDASYRNRFYLYLRSLSRATLESLEFAVSTVIPNVRVKAIESRIPGFVNIFVDSPQVISRNLISRINEIIDEYKSAGILVNLRPTKVEYLTVLVDVDSDSLPGATERARTIISNAFNEKQLSNTVNYTELHELLDLTTINKINNLYYGMYLTADVFNLFKTTLTTEVYGPLSPGFSAEFSGNYNEANYFDVFNSVMNGDIILFDRGQSSINYPLVSLVRQALQMDANAYTDNQQKIIQQIQINCNESNVDVCLENIRSASTPYFTISISDLETMVSQTYANYYKLKFLTIPNVRYKDSTYAENKIIEFAYNDISKLQYEDLLEINLDDFSKVRLARNLTANESLYRNSSLVATRTFNG